MGKRINPTRPSPRDVSIFERVAVAGQRQSVVARESGLSRQRVSKICDRVGHLVFQELTENVADHRRQTLLRLENLYRVSLAAWQESKSVRCLTEARLALTDIRRMCGLDMPEKEILELRTVQQISAEVKMYSREDLEKLATLARLHNQGAVRLIPTADDRGGAYWVEMVEASMPTMA